MREGGALMMLLLRMWGLSVFSTILVALCFWGSPQVFSDGDNEIFELGDFRFESGVTLPNARLSYVTHGALNASSAMEASKTIC